MKDRIITITLGEKKRIAIATVLSMSPELLVIDEPTSSLDPRGRWELIELLRGLPLTKVIATHDLELVRDLCQRAVLLDGGRVVADDLTRRVLSDVPLLASHGLAPPMRGKRGMAGRSEGVGRPRPLLALGQRDGW